MWGVVVFLAGMICLRMAFRDMEKEAEAARRRNKKVVGRKSVRHVDTQHNSIRHVDARYNDVQCAKRTGAPSGRPNRVRHINAVGDDYGVRRVPTTRQPGKRNTGYCATGSTVPVRCCQR